MEAAISSDPPTIEYATPSLPRPPSIHLFRLPVGAAVVVAAVAILIVLGYAVTRIDAFMLLGVTWLLVGATITSAAFILGLVYAVRARAAHYPPPHSIGRARLALWAPLVNVPLAILCTVAGAALEQRASMRVTFELRNATAVPIDRVTVTSSVRVPVTSGPIAPGASVWVGAMLTQDGEENRVVVRVTQGGRTWDQVALVWHDEDDVRGAPNRAVELEPATAGN